MLGGGFVVLGMLIPLLLVVMDWARVMNLRDSWAVISLGVGLVLFLAALAVGPWPYRLMHPSDRRSDWDQVGWPEH